MAENILQSDAAKAWEWFRRFAWDASVSFLDWAKNKLMDYVLNKVEDPVEALWTATKVLDFTTWTSTSILNDKLKEDYNKKKEQVKNITSLKQIREASKNLDKQKRKQFEKEMIEYLKKNNPEVYKAYLKGNKQKELELWLDKDWKNLPKQTNEAEDMWIGIDDTNEVKQTVIKEDVINNKPKSKYIQWREIKFNPNTKMYEYESKQEWVWIKSFKTIEEAESDINTWVKWFHLSELDKWLKWSASLDNAKDFVNKYNKQVDLKSKWIDVNQIYKKYWFKK